jgi:hypothetical protein
MDKETREFLDRKFNAVDERFAGIDEKFEETKRYFGVVAEGLKHKIRLVAEGITNLNEKLGRQIEENEAARREILSAIRITT